MKKELPSVFQNPIQKEFNNVQETFQSGERKETSLDGNPKKVTKKINEIFNRKDFVYKKRVRIYTKEDVLEKDIVGRNGVALLTLDNQQIFIHDIMNIEPIE